MKIETFESVIHSKKRFLRALCNEYRFELEKWRCNITYNDLRVSLYRLSAIALIGYREKREELYDVLLRHELQHYGTTVIEDMNDLIDIDELRTCDTIVQGQMSIRSKGYHVVFEILNDIYVERKYCMYYDNRVALMQRCFLYKIKRNDVEESLVKIIHENPRWIRADFWDDFRHDDSGAWKPLYL